MASKTKSGPVEEFVFSDWLKEGAEGIRRKFECKVEKRTRHFDTTEFRSHMRRARKEQLLAMRSLIDSALDCVKGEEKKPAA